MTKRKISKTTRAARKTRKVRHFAPKTVDIAIHCVQTAAEGCGVEPWELTSELLEAFLERKNYTEATRRKYRFWVFEYLAWAASPEEAPHQTNPDMACLMGACGHDGP